VTDASSLTRRATDLGVDTDLAVRMFEVMVLTRAVEDRMVAMYRGGDLLGSLYTGHWHEAISVGAASTLRPDDYMAPLHRNLGAHLWRGMPAWQVMASFMGRATSPTGGRDGTLHYGRLDLGVYNPPSHIPANFPVATGMAFAAKYRGQDRVCLAFCGDGSTSRADFHEALSIASVQKLPNIFVIENNQYSYSTPLRLTSASRRRSPPRRSPPASPASGSPVRTSSRCTARWPRPWPALAPTRGRRSSRA
jgi:TPP-dependent pyruvate/acetoin dehydrogenase alpha subunit